MMANEDFDDCICSTLLRPTLQRLILWSFGDRQHWGRSSGICIETRGKCRTAQAPMLSADMAPDVLHFEHWCLRRSCSRSGRTELQIMRPK
jgi:hypothetical protein